MSGKTMESDSSNKISSEDSSELILLLEIVPVLHKNVTMFQKAVSNEFINTRRETQAQQLASFELVRLEKGKMLVEKTFEGKSEDEIQQLQTKMERVLLETRRDIVNYETAMLCYNRRQEEYNESNSITRQFLSPRTRFAQAWAAEEAMTPRRHTLPEVTFLGIAVGVFFVLSVFSIFVNGPYPSKIHDILMNKTKHEL